MTPSPQLLERARAGDQEARDHVVAEALPLIQASARRFAARRRGVASEDLLGAGFEGVLGALRTFDPNAGASWRTHVARRVQGAFLDQVRAESRVGRWAARGVREAEARCSALAQDLGRRPSAVELEEAFGAEALRKASAASALMICPQEVFEEEAGGDADPLQALALREGWGQALHRFTRRERRLVELYFRHGITLAEIGAAFGISESLASKLLAKAKARALTGPRRGQPPDRGHRNSRSRWTPEIGTHYAAAREGRAQGGKAPFGYQWLCRRLFVLEAEARVVRLIFERYLEPDGSTPKVRDWLAERGHPTRAGRPWNTSTLSRILKNETYRGVVKYGEVRAQGRHRPIIDQEAFEAVQAKLASRPSPMRRRR